MKQYKEIDLTQKYQEVEHLAFTMRGVYTKRCNCGENHEVRTQTDSSPEYYTNIYLKCGACGEYVKFELPVN